MRIAVSVVLLVVVLLTSPAAAQQRQMGVKVGPTFPALVVEPDDAEYKTRLAATYGGFVVFPRSPRFALQLEALYSAKGGKASSDVVEETLTFKFDYIEVPVLGRVTATRSASRSIFVFGGLAPAIRTGAKAESGTQQGGFTYGISTNVGEDYRRFDVALVLGAGVDVGQYLTFDGRYSWGLVNIYTNEEIEAKVRNRALTFMGGVRF